MGKLEELAENITTLALTELMRLSNKNGAKPQKVNSYEE